MKSKKLGEKSERIDQAAERRARWLRDPAAFCAECLVNPETGKSFELYPIQRRFLKEALTLTPQGTLPYSEIVFSCPKKSGKSATTAMAMLYAIVVIGGPFAEGFCVANDFEQAKGRVFMQICRIIEASPLLRGSATITQNRIVFTSSGSTISAIASDAAGAAGSNPTFIAFDELWAYTSEASRRLWDEMIPVPTRKVSARMTSTYAGFDGESTLLEDLYRRGMKGRQIAPALRRQRGMLMLWSHEPIAPWQTKSWLQQMREQHRPNAYLRQIENRWVSTESSFVDIEWYDACVDPTARPVAAAAPMQVWVGVDASTKRDSTAVAVCAWDNDLKKVRLVAHKIWQPSKSEPLDFEQTIEKFLLELRRRFRVRECLYDPYQMQATAQRLQRAGVNMREFPQTIGNLTEASNNLYEVLKGANIVLYPDQQIRAAVQKSVAIETPRGWKISKEKASAKIDVVIALAQAALGAVQGQSSEPGWLGFLRRESSRQSVAAGTPVADAAAAAGLGPAELSEWIDRVPIAPKRVAASKPTPGQEEAWEMARKLCESGLTVERAIAETFKVHRIAIDPAALEAYCARVNQPIGPSRPRFAPHGATNPFV
jgi:phage terminase large subunit-like protein